MSQENLHDLKFDKLSPEAATAWNASPETMRKNVVNGLRHYRYTFEDLTCSACPVVAECHHYRFDLYNTGGDCLAMK